MIIPRGEITGFELALLFRTHPDRKAIRSLYSEDSEYYLPNETVIRVFKYIPPNNELIDEDSLWVMGVLPEGDYTVVKYDTGRVYTINAYSGETSFIQYTPTFELKDKNGTIQVLPINANNVQILKFNGKTLRAQDNWAKVKTDMNARSLAEQWQLRAAERTYAPGGLGATQAISEAESLANYGLFQGGRKKSRKTRKTRKNKRSKKRRKISKKSKKYRL